MKLNPTEVSSKFFGEIEPCRSVVEKGRKLRRGRSRIKVFGAIDRLLYGSQDLPHLSNNNDFFVLVDQKFIRSGTHLHLRTVLLIIYLTLLIYLPRN